MLLSITSHFLHSQELNSKDSLRIDNSVYTMVPIMPLFLDAKNAEESDALVFNYLKEKVKKENQKEKGNVYLSFIIDKDGNPIDVKIRKGASDKLNDLATKFILEMPKWTPGEFKNQKVKIQFTVPVMFK